jgi:hypothetical protein
MLAFYYSIAATTKTSDIQQNSIIFMSMRMSSATSSLNHDLSNIYEEWQ